MTTTTYKNCTIERSDVTYGPRAVHLLKISGGASHPWLVKRPTEAPLITTIAEAKKFINQALKK